MDLILQPSSLALPLSEFRKFPGFRGPIDLETWRLERRMWLQRPSLGGGACLMGREDLPGRLWYSRAGKKGEEGISPEPSSGSRHWRETGIWDS